MDQDGSLAVPSLQVRDLRTQVPAVDLGRSPFRLLKGVEKTAFGVSFIAVAIGPSDAAQCGPMVS